MSIATHIKNTFQLPQLMLNECIGDLTAEEMYVWPIKGTNHFTWQLGHLIASENYHINQICPGDIPELPKGFNDLFTKDTSLVDDPSFFPITLSFSLIFRDVFGLASQVLRISRPTYLNELLCKDSVARTTSE